MGHTLTEIAQTLRNATHTNNARLASTVDVKVQLIYAFNGTGKTRLSREFKKIITSVELPLGGAETVENANLNDPISNEDGVLDDNVSVLNQEEVVIDYEDEEIKVLYYNAFTEDLFYWDNSTNEPTLKIQPNTFTNWVLSEEGQDQNITSIFQHYTNDKLTPHFNESFSEIKFTFERGNEESSETVKISKGEESCFIWSVFCNLLDQVIDVLNIAESDERSTNKFDNLEYVFIDDPVSSLDENHLIELAVHLAKLIKSNESGVKFIITTHNPLFYNVLHNELKDGRYKKYILSKLDDGTYQMSNQSNDSPFSYHLLLKKEIENAIISGQISKYHFNFLRNILEKTATFLGRTNWGDLLPERTEGERDLYLSRIINISSHSKHSSEEIYELTDDHKRILEYIMRETEVFGYFRN
ncbi:AAA family ATPase [Pedobacter sp. UBA5917]|jgi:wobble nucleotide-excising tRNase|uniref:AAA family ATPase n=1 Tax=Pedobacter sp. UBA5917 TaxID=1947061 RepID=UPI0025F1E054|nr:AAA family ATPase [Pedobacter sp. UBA5917]